MRIKPYSHVDGLTKQFFFCYGGVVIPSVDTVVEDVLALVDSVYLFVKLKKPIKCDVFATGYEK